MQNFDSEQHKAFIHSQLKAAFMFVFIKNTQKKNITLTQGQLNHAKNNLARHVGMTFGGGGGGPRTDDLH